MADAPDKAESAAAKSDPLKWYCGIFLVMIVGLAVLYFKRDGDRKALEAANAQAKVWFNSALPRNEADDRPNDIPGLAFEVEQLAEAYLAAGGQEANTISEAKMKQYATQAGMTEYKLGGDVSDPNKGRGYTTLTRTFEYMPATLDNFVRMAYNVDSSARYRVMELSWNLLSKKEGNTTEPFHKIGRSSIKVALRKAIPKN
jgi:hypothetical protein